MQIYTNTNSTFPDQVVPDDVKATPEYGYRAVGDAVQTENGERVVLQKIGS